MKTTKKQMVQLEYNGFHGRQNFRVLAIVEQANIDPYTPYTQLTISRNAALRINRQVGCKSHKIVYGVSYKIQGACGCGEGIQDISMDDIHTMSDVAFYAQDLGDNYYEYRGRYPQN